MSRVNLDLSKPWREIFALVAEAKVDEKREKHEAELLAELDRQDTEKRIAEVKRERKEEDEKASELMIATTERLAAFSSRLDDLDAASVNALMRNDEAMERVEAQLGAMLDKAEKLPDGRRMFKTEDGTRVFDEHGAELSSAVVDPNAISDLAPRWEPFKALQDQKHEIETQRHELLKYQEKLDQTRARLDKGGVTKNELDALDADLKSTMPAAVRDSLGHRGTEAGGPNLNDKVPAAPDQSLALPRAAPSLSPVLN